MLEVIDKERSFKVTVKKMTLADIVRFGAK